MANMSFHEWPQSLLTRASNLEYAAANRSGKKAIALSILFTSHIAFHLPEAKGYRGLPINPRMLGPRPMRILWAVCFHHFPLVLWLSPWPTS